MTLFDPRQWGSDTGREIPSIDKAWGVRSIACNEHILSLGTGRGNVYFFDLRAWKYLENDEGDSIALRTSEGWIRRDSNYYTFFNSIAKLPNAVYTHSYSPNNKKLYVAGGPLQLGLYGNYSSIWQKLFIYLNNKVISNRIVLNNRFNRFNQFTLYMYNTKLNISSLTVYGIDNLGSWSLKKC